MNNLTPQDRNTLDNYSGMSVGQIFRRARADHGYDLMDIATHLNIGSTHLEAIEADDVNSLPPKVYAVGFVRAYADVLALDPEKMAYLFKVQFYGKSQTDQRKFMVRPEGKSVSLQDTLSQKDNVLPAILSAAFVALLVVIGFIFFIVWLITPSDKTGEITVPEVPAQMSEALEEGVDNTAIADEMPPEVIDVPEPIDVIAVKPDEGKTAYGADPMEAPLAFKMIDKSWLDVRDLQTGAVLLTRTLEKGDVLYIAEGQDILMTTGNAGGVEPYLDGESLGVLGNDAEIIRSRPFSVEALRLQQKN